MNILINLSRKCR